LINALECGCYRDFEKRTLRSQNAPFQHHDAAIVRRLRGARGAYVNFMTLTRLTDYNPIIKNIKKSKPWPLFCFFEIIAISSLSSLSLIYFDEFFAYRISSHMNKNLTKIKRGLNFSHCSAIRARDQKFPQILEISI
jgi:hypothetical protein